MLGLLKKKNPTQVDCQEAYNLWDGLTSRYNTIQQVQIWHNFVHDKEFSLLLKHAYMELMDKQANKMEQIMNDYQLALPKRPPQNINTSANVEAYEDRFLASIAINMIQENITQQIRFIRTSLTNESVRKMFIDFLGQGVDLYDSAIKYVKLKGWLSLPPLYKQVPLDNDESIDVGEAYHLWRLRGMYRKFLDQEISALDNWINYGKLKGWLRPIPMFTLK